jgi:hypothetical protein
MHWGFKELYTALELITGNKVQMDLNQFTAFKNITNHWYQKLLQVFVLHPFLLLPAHCHELLAVTSYSRGGCQSGSTTRANIAALRLYWGLGVLGIVDLVVLFILN